MFTNLLYSSTVYDKRLHTVKPAIEGELSDNKPVSAREVPGAFPS